jgi:hypothetical protein
MTANVYDVLSQRAQTHGHFPEHAQITQDIKLTMIHARNWNVLTAPQREALEMIAHKIGRILAGDPNMNDHWDDAAGYATLASQAITLENPVTAKVTQSSSIPSSMTTIGKQSKTIVDRLHAAMEAADPEYYASVNAAE